MLWKSVYGKKEENTSTKNYTYLLRIILLQKGLKAEGNIFTGKEIMCIEIIAQGFGGFKFPVFFTDKPSQFVETMERSHQYFMRRLPTFSDPDHSFNSERDITPLRRQRALPNSPVAYAIFSTLTLYHLSKIKP